MSIINTIGCGKESGVVFSLVVWSWNGHLEDLQIGPHSSSWCYFQGLFIVLHFPCWYFFFLSFINLKIYWWFDSCRNWSNFSEAYLSIRYMICNEEVPFHFWRLFLLSFCFPFFSLLCPGLSIISKLPTWVTQGSPFGFQASYITCWPNFICFCRLGSIWKSQSWSRKKPNYYNLNRTVFSLHIFNHRSNHGLSCL